MFFIVVFSCSTLSLLMGATFYVKYGNNLNEHKTFLLNHFPEHTEYSDMVQSAFAIILSGGYTLESFDTYYENEFLSNIAISKTLYKINITLLIGEVSLC